MGRCRWPGLRARLSAQNEGRFARTGIHEADGDAPIRLRQDLREDVAGHQFVACRQDHLVPPNTQAAIENNCLALAVVALRILVRLDDQDAPLPLRRNGTRQLHFDVIPASIGAGHEWILRRLRTRDNFKVQRLPSHRIVDRFVARRAPLPNRIEVRLGAGSGGGHFIKYLEARRLRPPAIRTACIRPIRFAAPRRTALYRPRAVVHAALRRRKAKRREQW